VTLLHDVSYVQKWIIWFCVCPMLVPCGLKHKGMFSVIQGGSNMTGADLCVNKPHCAAAVRPWESEATKSTLPPARVRTCSVLSGSC